MADELPPDAPPRHAGDGPDDPALLLQASRRIDWRFLLPRPQLACIVYIGRHDAALIGALRAHADLTIVGADTDQPSPSAFDLAALKDASLGSISAGRDLVRPGGWVYAEVRRVLRRHGAAPAGARPVSRWRRAFVDTGLTEVTAHWHVPNHDAAAFLVPLGDPAGVRLVLRRHQGSAAGHAKAMAGRLLAATGLVELAVRDASVLGRRPPLDGGRR
jgi:hypothetical protein